MRLTNTILTDGFADSRKAPMVDLSLGGQNGRQTDFSTYVSNTAYVRRNLKAFVMETPEGFQDTANPSKWVATLKALVELHPKSIEGLNGALTVEVVENAAGGAGEMQEDPSNVTRARSQPVFVWTERYGKPINAFIRNWIELFLMDPITKVPGIMSSGTTKPSDILPDYYAMTVMFVECDPTDTKVIDAWLCTNMYPKSDGTVEGRREMAAAMEGVDHSIEFTALTQKGRGVNAVAQALINAVSATPVNPNTQPAFIKSISADVAAATTVGYKEQVAAMVTAAASNTL